jgi:hypothetical protein
LRRCDDMDEEMVEETDAEMVERMLEENDDEMVA